jgi:hypothetical protein
LPQVNDSLKSDIPDGATFDVKFAGYVAQKYIQKTTEGERRAVAAFETIMKRIPRTIKTNFIDKLQHEDIKVTYQIGQIPNLYSLIPMSQTAHKPVFALEAKDGVRGAHFNKVREPEKIIGRVAARLLENVEELSG